MYLKEIKTIFRNELHGLYPRDEVDSFFYLFMEHYLGLERFGLVLQPNLVVSKKEEQPFFEGLARLKKEEPIQYVLGEAYFMELKFRVNPNVLIPRPETEELVGWIIEEIGNRNSAIRILDIGTGSGAIAIALAKSLPNVTILGLDVSNKALEVARKNAELNKAEVKFIHADILDVNLELEFEFDCIVSNPPYVREMEKKGMGNNVKNYEPEAALFVSDVDPLKFYKAISAFSLRHLRPKGSLFFEVNQYLSKETEDVLVNNHFDELELRKDIFGNFRMLKGTKP
ncbi:MAG: peptide chain release factor N(5)-glutamine methyltransferase [Bacteroidota bacterium]